MGFSRIISCTLDLNKCAFVMISAIIKIAVACATKGIKNKNKPKNIIRFGRDCSLKNQMPKRYQSASKQPISLPNEHLVAEMYPPWNFLVLVCPHYNKLLLSQY